MSTRMFKTGDKILISGIAVIAVILMAWNATGASPGPGREITAVIKQDGNAIRRIDLSDLKDPEDIRLTYNGIHQVILAEKGRIRFSESDCPNKICVKSGWLTKPGDRAVCMPSRVMIEIVGGNKPVDSVSY